MPGQGLSKKKLADYQRERPKRFFAEEKPPEGRPVPSSEPMTPASVPTTSNKNIALVAPSTLTSWEDSATLHLIPLGSLHSTFTCRGSPLAVVEDRNQRSGLVSKLSIAVALCVASLMPSQIHIRSEIWRLTASLC